MYKGKVSVSASHRCVHKDGITGSKGKQMRALKDKKFAEERGAKEGDGTALDGGHSTNHGT